MRRVLVVVALLVESLGTSLRSKRLMLNNGNNGLTPLSR